MAKKKIKAAEFTCDFPGYDGTEYRKECDVGNGAWVLVKCRVPVAEAVRPQVYGIYWATPAEDKWGRQKVTIYTPTVVCLLNREYSVVSEERLQEYRECGYFLRDYGIEHKDPLTLKMVEQSRALCEDERSIIWALMLDGLTESQACEEYYLSHHTDVENVGRCYLPTAELLAEIVAMFGEDGYCE